MSLPPPSLASSGSVSAWALNAEPLTSVPPAPVAAVGVGGVAPAAAQQWGGGWPSQPSQPSGTGWGGGPAAPQWGGASWGASRLPPNAGRRADESPGGGS
eukprot:3789607-Prymnesium_polylepis.2